MSSAFDKMVKARTSLLLERPIWGALLLRLKTEEVTWLDTMGVDGKSLFFNPDFVMDTPMPELKGVLVHEALHVALLHPFRRGGRDPRFWNIAGDYVVNPLVKDEGLKLPEGGLLDPQYKGLPTEKVYELVYRKGPKGGGEGKEGKGGEQGQGGKAPDGRNVPPDPSKCGSVLDAPVGVNEDPATSYREQEQEWKIALAQAAQLQRAHGMLGGNMEELVKEALAPKAPWIALLREFLTAHSRDDYSWLRPNRRHIANGLYLPSAYSESLGEAVIAIDTSGSISGELLAQFEGEFNNILEEVKLEKLWIISGDTRVNHVQEITPEDYPVKLVARGRGGTNFQPMFDWVEEKGIEPVVFIYLTDMYAGMARDPGYPVLWADFGGGGAPDQPFGERIIVE